MKSVIAALLAAGLFLLMIAPDGHRRAECLRGQCFAHRGLYCGGIPENSDASFARAIALGTGIEMDVQLSADAVPVVFHDVSLLRMCGVRGSTGGKTLAELKSLRLEGSGQRIPALQESLNRIAGEVPLLLEIKTGLHPGRLCRKVCEALQGYSGIAAVQSFDPLILLRMRLRAPKYLRCQLIASPKHHRGIAKAGIALLSLMPLNFLARPDMIALNIAAKPSVSLRLIRRLQPVPLAVWDVRDPEDDLRIRAEGNISIFEGFLPQQPKTKKDCRCGDNPPRQSLFVRNK